VRPVRTGRYIYLNRSRDSASFEKLLKISPSNPLRPVCGRPTYRRQAGLCGFARIIFSLPLAGSPSIILFTPRREDAKKLCFLSEVTLADDKTEFISVLSKKTLDLQANPQKKDPPSRESLLKNIG